MASVTSLDGDLRRMRLDKYTPAAAREVRQWIEGILGEPLAAGDLLDALKDGTALCRLANLALPPPGIRFKKSSMPFVQMENISHFLRACQSPPLNLLQHDTFLTVDLYETKDPAQVLQCLGAFSRAAHKANPSAFPSAIGARPASTVAPPTSPGRSRPMSSVYSGRTPLAPTQTGGSVSGSGRRSPTKTNDDTSLSPTPTSSWSKRELEGATSPAWNIAQYGYMGGASQGNLGISFGGRRQITSAGPSVPNAAEKMRLRREKEADEARAKQAMEEEERRRRAALEADEARLRREEQLRWEAESQRQLAEEKRRVEEERRKWEEEERQWKMTEEARKREEAEAEARLAEERRARLNKDAEEAAAYSNRVRELEAQLEKARLREQEYELERQGRSKSTMNTTATTTLGVADDRTRSRSRGARSRSRPRAVPNLASPPVRQESWSRNDKEVLMTPRSRSRHRFADPERAQSQAVSETETDDAQFNPGQTVSPRPLPDPRNHMSPLQPPSQPQAPQLPPRETTSGAPLRAQRTGGGRPLPDPAAYSSPPVAPKPQPQRPTQDLPPQPTYARELLAGGSAEHDAEDRRRRQLAYQQSAPSPSTQLPQPTQPTQPTQRRGPFGGQSPGSTTSSTTSSSVARPGKSLLEREMELERQRQREWEEAQRETAAAPRQAEHVEGIDGRWDVNQWNGFTGGDNQNRGTQGIGAGRRQIVGPRPLPGQR